MMHDESRHNVYPKTNLENQVSELFPYCLKVLGDPMTTKNTPLARWIKEGDNDIAIYAPLPERDVHHGNRGKHRGKEFKMTVELGNYEMKGIMLDMGYNVNIFPKKSWELMGKPKLMRSLIQIRLANQYNIYSIGRLEKVKVNIDGVKTKEYFEVIEIMDDSDPYLAFLGID
jgi:hypothetical protein